MSEIRPQKKRGKYLKWIILFVIVAAIGGFIAYSVLRTELPKVQTDTVATKELVQKISAPGKIQPVEEVDISAYVSAEITKLYVDEGDPVKKGQKLVDLDSTRYRATLDQANAGLFAARANGRLADARFLQSQRHLNRTKELFAKDLVGKQELEEAETAHLVNKAQLEASKDEINRAQAVLRMAQDDVAKTTLNAPIDGTISRLAKEKGEVVLGSQLTRDIIMTVADLSKMEVIVEVDENDVVDVQLGDEAEIEVDAYPKETFKGQVTKIAISPKLQDQLTQQETTNFEVTVLLSEEVEKLRPGMNCTANIITDRRDSTLTLPIQCITMRNPKTVKADEGADQEKETKTEKKVGRDQLKEVVFKYSEEGKAEMAEVKTGISSETEMEILEGLDESDEVICGPYKTLHKDMQDGMEVEKSDTDEINEEEKK